MASMVSGVGMLYSLIKELCMRPITAMTLGNPRVNVEDLATVLHHCNQFQISALVSRVHLREARHFSFGTDREIVAIYIVERSENRAQFRQ